MASSKKIRIFLRRCWTPAKMIHPCASVRLGGVLIIIIVLSFLNQDHNKDDQIQIRGQDDKKLESVGRGINYSETRKVSQKLLPRGLRNFFFQRLRHHFFDLVLCIIFSFSVSTIIIHNHCGFSPIVIIML